MVARGYFIPGHTSERAVFGRQRSMSYVVRARLEQTCGMSHHDGFRQPHSNFSNRPYPLARNHGTVLMGIVLWQVTENPKITILGLGPNLSDFPQKRLASQNQASSGNSGWRGGIRRQTLVQRSWSFLQTVATEDQNDQTRSKTT